MTKFRNLSKSSCSYGFKNFSDNFDINRCSFFFNSFNFHVSFFEQNSISWPVVLGRNLLSKGMEFKALYAAMDFFRPGGGLGKVFQI